MMALRIPGLRATMAVARPLLALAVLVVAAQQVSAQAQTNAIEAISANQQGANVIVKVSMKNPPQKAPIGFMISNPARIALDFGETANATGKSVVELGMADVRSVNVVQAGPRSRLVFNLKRNLNYATTIDGNAVIITIDGSGGPATAVNAAGLPAAPPLPVRLADGGLPPLRNLDFRRGPNGEGRILVDLPNNQTAVDVRQVGDTVLVDFLKTALPATLRRRLDVADFGTPVSQITTTVQGDKVHMVIAAHGIWEQSVYQSETQLVVDVKPVKEDPNKLTQGTQGFRGEKLSFNFQNVDVRAVLQAIADISGLNIITSDTVSGSLTLRLKDVPWDQALQVVMQAKGLDMRKNGTVIWIAPKEEMLTKEKLELEQRAQIAELEPLRSEIFQLNYQKAESFRTVFGLDASGNSSAGSGTNQNRVLSKRGSAVIDPRSNQLFVTDIASKIEDIRKLIAKTDVAAKQVLIETRIVEATDSFNRNLGVKLGTSTTRVSPSSDGTITTPDTSTYSNGTSISLPAAAVNGTAASTIAVSLFSSAANRFLNLELSAIEADGTGKIISSPRVVTADKVEALIEQGTEIPYQEASSSGATTTSFKKANLSLKVTPQITPDGNVVLDVDVNKDSVGTATSSGLAIDTKHVQTQVMVENGGTVVLGGIYTSTDSDSVSKVPLLGDIPGLGFLFRSTTKAKAKTELLVFITPKIMAQQQPPH